MCRKLAQYWEGGYFCIINHTIKLLIMNNFEFWTGTQKHIVWEEYVNGQSYYWEKVNGVSTIISKRRFDNLKKKHVA